MVSWGKSQPVTVYWSCLCVKKNIFLNSWPFIFILCVNDSRMFKLLWFSLLVLMPKPGLIMTYVFLCLGDLTSYRYICYQSLRCNAVTVSVAEGPSWKKMPRYDWPPVCEKGETTVAPWTRYRGCQEPRYASSKVAMTLKILDDIISPSFILEMKKLFKCLDRHFTGWWQWFWFIGV